MVASHTPGSTGLGGMAAGFAFGLAPLVWSQAVITEVYALQAALTALFLLLYTRPVSSTAVDQKRLDLWRGLALGLAMGNHVTTLLLFPAALALGSLRATQAERTAGSVGRQWKLDRASLVRQLAMFLAGCCIYLILPLRALSNPPVNWGNVVTPARLWWLVSGQLYQSYYLRFSLVHAWETIQTDAGLLLAQFGLVGLLLGLIGLLLFGVRSRLYALTIWIAVASLAFTSIYASSDFYVYLIPLCLAFAIWIGLGADNLLRAIPAQRTFIKVALGMLLIASFLNRSVVNSSAVDASHDRGAETFGRQALADLPANAILFAKGDEAIFALWYFHFALGERPDVVVVAQDLLHFDWYQETLRATYPAVQIPGPFPWPETIASANPGRAACRVRYDGQMEMDCSEP